MTDKEYTVKEILAEAEKALVKHEIPEPSANARLLFQHLLKISDAEMIQMLPDILPADQIAQYSALLKRRMKREPLQYITRKASFWNLELYVDERVLVPRPESEHIIEEVLKDFPEKDKILHIADIGTGSGNLPLALAGEYPKAKFYCTDIDSGAIEIATINATRNNVTNRVTYFRGDLCAPLLKLDKPKGMNLLISNPPYIAEKDIPTLAPEVIKAEPTKALIAGATGLEIYARLMPQIESLLKKGGMFYLEIGMGQDQSVKTIIDNVKNLEFVRAVNDHRDIPRVIVGRKVR